MEIDPISSPRSAPSVCFCVPCVGLLRWLPSINNRNGAVGSSVSSSPTPPKRTSRPNARAIRGHRFSKDAVEPLLSAQPISPLVSATTPPNWPAPMPPPADAPHVYLIDPGSGEACSSFQRLQSFHVHLAVQPTFDQPVKRYPPHWRSMRGVRLAVAEAEADAAADERAAAAAEFGKSWPGISDLRGSAHPYNLATWASTLYESSSKCLRAVDLSATGCDRSSARHAGTEHALRLVSSYSCLVCGSRGGEVTLPALWLLGCQLPCVVINAGCARKAAQWVWPPGVPVVLLTGGSDRICNEFFQRPDRDAEYIRRVWQAVPRGSQATTAILHLPRMTHRPDAQTLADVLPSLVRWAASGLAPEAAPSAQSLGGRTPCMLVTSEHPEGRVLVRETSATATAAAS